MSGSRRTSLRVAAGSKIEVSDWVVVPQEGEEENEKYIHVFEGTVLRLVKDPQSCPDVGFATNSKHPMALVEWDPEFKCPPLCLADSWVPLDLDKYKEEKKRWGWALLKDHFVRYCDELRAAAGGDEEQAAKRRKPN